MIGLSVSSVLPVSLLSASVGSSAERGAEYRLQEDGEWLVVGGSITLSPIMLPDGTVHGTVVDRKLSLLLREDIDGDRMPSTLVLPDLQGKRFKLVACED